MSGVIRDDHLSISFQSENRCGRRGGAHTYCPSRRYLLKKPTEREFYLHCLQGRIKIGHHIHPTFLLTCTKAQSELLQRK